MGLVGAPLVSPCTSRPACWTPAGLGREPPTCTTHPSFRLAPIIIIFIVVIIIAIIFINVIIIMVVQQGHKIWKIPSGKTILLTMLLQPRIKYFFSPKRAILLKMQRYFLVHSQDKRGAGANCYLHKIFIIMFKIISSSSS